LILKFKYNKIQIYCQIYTPLPEKCQRAESRVRRLQIFSKNQAFSKIVHRGSIGEFLKIIAIPGLWKIPWAEKLVGRENTFRLSEGTGTMARGN
jgi:hypothetical protein